jgi:hypothetical protein
MAEESTTKGAAEMSEPQQGEKLRQRQQLLLPWLIWTRNTAMVFWWSVTF